MLARERDAHATGRRLTGDHLDKGWQGAGFGAAQRFFEFAPHLLDGVKVRGVGRQEQYVGAQLLDGVKGFNAFVR